MKQLPNPLGLYEKQTHFTILNVMGAYFCKVESPYCCTTDSLVYLWV